MADEERGFFGKICDTVKNYLSRDDESDENYENEETEETEADETSAPAEEQKTTSTKKETKTMKTEDLKNLNIKIIKPGDDKSAITTILDSLKNNQVVVVNFEETRIDVRASFSDAFFGATYVLNANYTKLSETTYVLAPKNVAVSPLISGMADSSASSDEFKSSKGYFGSM
jgi:FtsZ-interacting cell division protein YlmF